MRSWVVTSGPAGANLKLYEFGVRNSVKQRLYSAVDFVDGRLLGHALCGSGLPELAWRIPVGRPDYDAEDGMLNNSLGSLLYDSYSRLVQWVDATEARDLVEQVPLSEAQARALAPSLFEDETEVDRGPAA